MTPITTARRIVVIEDDSALRSGLADNLRAESYDVLTAADGEAGYRMVRDNHPDLVILDILLPRMNGYEVCRQLRRNGVATPVLILTAQDRESHRVAGFEVGADDYVTKPFSLKELLGRVRAILRRSEGRSDLANQKELDDALKIQQRLMPAEIPQIPGCRIAATYRPARIVGGDYFDVLKLDDGAVGICIADVCGKGMPAALMMANLQAAVKTCAAKRMRPKDLCEAVNRVMCDNLASQGFISFFYGVLSAGSKQFTYCNAGHNPPILGRLPESIRFSHGGVVLGVLPDGTYEEDSLPLRSGDCMLLYTDGITESRSPGGEEFSDTRMLDLVRQTPTGDAAALAEVVISAATRFNHGNFDDDVTVVAISVD